VSVLLTCSFDKSQYSGFVLNNMQYLCEVFSKLCAFNFATTIEIYFFSFLNSILLMSFIAGFIITLSYLTQVAVEIV